MRFETGLKFLGINTKLVFFKSGHSRASFRFVDIIPDFMELLTRSLNAGAITSRCSLSRDIGRGSSSHDFDGADLTIVFIVSSSISKNSSNFTSVVQCDSIYFRTIGLTSLD